MENNNKPLTAEEITQIAQAHFTRTRPGPLTEKIVNEMYGFEEGYRIAIDHTTKQTAALQQELEAVKKGRDTFKKWFSAAQEAVVSACNQRDEAVKLLKDRILHDIEGDFMNKETGELYLADIPYHLLPVWRSEIIDALSSLSSGKTKSEFKCIHGLPDEATCIDCLDDAHRPPPESLTDKTE